MTRRFADRSTFATGVSSNTSAGEAVWEDILKLLLPATFAVSFVR